MGYIVFFFLELGHEQADSEEVEELELSKLVSRNGVVGSYLIAALRPIIANKRKTNSTASTASALHPKFDFL